MFQLEGVTTDDRWISFASTSYTWESFFFTIDNDNTVNGHPVVFIKNEVGGTVTGDVGQVNLQGKPD